MKAYVTVDLGFGDSGKGTIVDALVRKYSAEVVVRFNGGPQALHNVYNTDGRHHGFHQIGSGTFVPKTYTLLSRYMLVNPLLLMREAERLALIGVGDALNRVFIDDRCLMITPYHRALNCLKELARRDGKHGSCGIGLGECVKDELEHPGDGMRIGDFHRMAQFAGKFMATRERMEKQALALKDLPDTPEVAKQLSTFQYDLDKLFDLYREFYLAVGSRCIDAYQATRMLSSAKTAVFEAAQGVLLDENCGFHPYTTWSTTTSRNAKLLLEEAEITEKPTTIGILRSYSTRHGAGPFPTADQEMTRTLADPHNPRNPWQDGLRSGPLDLVLLEYALQCNGGVDYLAVTHMDKVTDPWQVCVRYGNADGLFVPTNQTQQADIAQHLMLVKPVIDRVSAGTFLNLLRQALKTPVAITSHGPMPQDKKFLVEFAEVAKD